MKKQGRIRDIFPRYLANIPQSCWRSGREHKTNENIKEAWEIEMRDSLHGTLEQKADFDGKTGETQIKSAV